MCSKEYGLMNWLIACAVQVQSVTNACIYAVKSIKLKKGNWIEGTGKQTHGE